MFHVKYIKYGSKSNFEDKNKWPINSWYYFFTLSFKKYSLGGWNGVKKLFFFEISHKIIKNVVPIVITIVNIYEFSTPAITF